MRSPKARALLAALVLTTLASACGGDGDDSGSDAASTPARTLEVTALDIEFEDPTPSVAAGNVEITLVQRGDLPHDFVVEGRPEIRLEVNPDSPGSTDSGVFEFDAGSYTFFCSVPGHRAAGMEGVLTITEP